MFKENMTALKFCILVIAFIPFGSSVPLEPGQPGGPWSSEEIDIVREKVGY